LEKVDRKRGEGSRELSFVASSEEEKTGGKDPLKESQRRASIENHGHERAIRKSAGEREPPYAI